MPTERTSGVIGYDVREDDLNRNMGLSLLTGTFHQNEARCMAFLESPQGSATTKVVACKAARYAFLREVIKTTQQKARLLPIQDKADFDFFVSQTACLEVDDLDEIQYLVESGYVSLPLSIEWEAAG